MWRELFTILIDKEKGVLTRIGPLIEPIEMGDTYPSSKASLIQSTSASASVPASKSGDEVTKGGHNYDPSISDEEYLLWYSSLGERVLPVPVRLAIARGLTMG